MVLFTLRSCLPQFSPIVLGLIADEVRVVFATVGDLGVPQRVLAMQGLCMRPLYSLHRVRITDDCAVTSDAGGTSTGRRQTRRGGGLTSAR